MLRWCSIRVVLFYFMVLNFGMIRQTSLFRDIRCWGKVWVNNKGNDASAYTVADTPKQFPLFPIFHDVKRNICDGFCVSRVD